MNQLSIMRYPDLSAQKIKALSVDRFVASEWAPVIELFWNRYNKRYFDQIDYLRESTDNQIKNNCGFLITTLDCVLIETLEQYYEGQDATLGKLYGPFLRFFSRSLSFSHLNFNKEDAMIFYDVLRSGLIHQSKAKKSSRINIRPVTAILEWIDKTNKKEGLMINRNKFHDAVKKEYELLIEALAKDENRQLRQNFKAKIITLLV